MGTSVQMFEREMFKRKGLDQIETDWSIVHEPAQLVMCYATAIQKYFAAIIKDPHDAEEAAQDFFLWVSQNGLPRAKRDRGRFRDYLKTVVRNAALNYLHRKRPPKHADFDLLHLLPDNTQPIPDQEWLSQWRQCLLNRVWKRLKKHEQKSPNNLCYTVLRLCALHPGEDSKTRAARLTQSSSHPLRAEAFRKQVSRARRLLAELLVEEIVKTLDNPLPERVEEELVDLGLMVYVRDFLPADWGTSGRFPSLELITK